MLISIRQINIDDFKEIFMQKDNYNIDAKRISGLNTVALTGNASKLNNCYVDNSIESDTTIWTSKKVVSEVTNLESEINLKLGNKVDTSIYNNLDSKVEDLTLNNALKTDRTDFDILKDELIKARKGHTSLLDKIEEIDNEIKKLTEVYSPKGKNLPIGSIIWYAGSTAPNSYAICDGSELDRNIYSDLFAEISTKYGEGNGSTTFNLPNLVSDYNFIRSAGKDYTVGSKQDENSKDVRESYEGSFMADKLYLVGGKYFTETTISSMEPQNITFIPCIKIECDDEKDSPIGIINWSATDNLNDDFLVCDGRELNRSKYIDLFKVIGTTYGSGNGSTTFNIPNLTSENLFIKNGITSGNKGTNNVTLTDVRTAYEGNENEDKLYPLGGKYFKTDVKNSELIPTSIALVPTIKVKKLKVSNGTNIGTFMWYPSSTLPSGYLLCDGRAISRVDYEDLFFQIGTTFGSGDGVSTFNLPDLVSENKFIRSYGGNISLGYVNHLNLKDIREAYEGDFGSDKLYPIGASRFTSNSQFVDIHPKNMALIPCIKAKDSEKVNLTSSINNLSNQVKLMINDNKSIKIDNVENQSLNNNITSSVFAENNNPIRVMKLNITMKDKIQKVEVNFNELSVVKVSSAFINVNTTSLGDNYICDIISNVVIKDNYLIVYVKCLDDKLISETIQATLNVVV